MSLKRGENWFKQVGRFSIQLARSSDGEWMDNGKLVGLIQIKWPRRAEAPHDDKMCGWVVLGEYTLFIAWYIRA